MSDRIILLVEDNPVDEELTLRALKKANIANRVVVARDGAEALDYLFARGAYAGRDSTETPQLVLLNLNRRSSEASKSCVFCVRRTRRSCSLWSF